jgi:hypothetical protein
MLIGRMHRTQILLEPEQHKVLEEIARHEGQSISEIVREILREVLPLRTIAARRQQEIKAIEKLRHIRTRVAQSYGLVGVDLIAEARAEREQQLALAQTGENQP